MVASRQRIFGAVQLAEEEGFETEVRRLVGAGLLLGSRRLESCSVKVARNQLGRLPEGNWDPTSPRSRAKFVAFPRIIVVPY